MGALVTTGTFLAVAALEAVDLLSISDVVDTLSLSYFRVQMQVCVWSLLRKREKGGGGRTREKQYQTRSFAGVGGDVWGGAQEARI